MLDFFSRMFHKQSNMNTTTWSSTWINTPLVGWDLSVGALTGTDADYTTNSYTTSRAVRLNNSDIYYPGNDTTSRVDTLVFTEQQFLDDLRMRNCEYSPLQLTVKQFNNKITSKECYELSKKYVTKPDERVVMDAITIPYSNDLPF